MKKIFALILAPVILSVLFAAAGAAASEAGHWSGRGVNLKPPGGDRAVWHFEHADNSGVRVEFELIDNELRCKIGGQVYSVYLMPAHSAEGSDSADFIWITDEPGGAPADRRARLEAGRLLVDVISATDNKLDPPLQVWVYDDALYISPERPPAEPGHKDPQDGGDGDENGGGKNTGGAAKPENNTLTVVSAWVLCGAVFVSLILNLTMLILRRK